MQVKDIMYSKLFKIQKDATIVEAAKMLGENNIGSLLVTNGSDTIGFLTTKDVVTRIVAAGKNPEETTVEEIMSSPIIMVDAKAEILEAAELLKKYQIKRLIVQERGTIVGIISTSKIGANLNRLLS